MSQERHYSFDRVLKTYSKKYQWSGSAEPLMEGAPRLLSPLPVSPAETEKENIFEAGVEAIGREEKKKRPKKASPSTKKRGLRELTLVSTATGRRNTPSKRHRGASPPPSCHPAHALHAPGSSAGNSNQPISKRF